MANRRSCHRIYLDDFDSRRYGQHDRDGRATCCPLFLRNSHVQVLAPRCDADLDCGGAALVLLGDE